MSSSSTRKGRRNSKRRNQLPGSGTASAAPRQHLSLEEKVKKRGGRHGFGLDTENRTLASSRSGRYGSVATTSKRASKRHGFRRNSSSQQQKNQPSPSSTTRMTPTKSVKGATHIVCSVAENLAKETCVASLDAGSPTSLMVVKQGNSETFAETLVYLDILQPDEILLNEGRRNSQLAKKILSLYNLSQGNGVATIPGVLPAEQGSAKKRKAKNNMNKYLTPCGAKVREEEKDGRNGFSSDACETSTVVKFVPRAYFDQKKGSDILRKIARKESYETTVVEEYILLSSSHAVLQYTQLCLGATFARNSVQLVVDAGGNSRMTIDRSSLLHLELLANAKTGKIANSLIGTIDRTKTSVGARLLRTNIMAPPTCIDAINTRLDLVDTFLADQDFFLSVTEHLEDLPDIDKMLSNIALVPWKKSRHGPESSVTIRMARKGISALVGIKTALSALPSLAQTLEDQLTKIQVKEQFVMEQYEKASDTSRRPPIRTPGSLSVALGDGSRPGAEEHSSLLAAILNALRKPALEKVLAAVTDAFAESTEYSRSAHMMRHQECFALRQGNNEKMDILRRNFRNGVDEIYDKADHFAEMFNTRVTVKYSESRGYHFALPTEQFQQQLPDIFIHGVKSGRFITCTTEEVYSISARAKETVQDLLLMTHERIQEILDTARSKYDDLAALCDAIALLDMCLSFADNVLTDTLPWSRPIVIPKGDMTIRKGRFGIRAPSTFGNDFGDFVPNDTYAPGHRNFVVVTGVNGAGKSTYLRQLAIIVVLAQCGSYVPAERAIIPVRERLCTRIGTADDQQHNISTFLMEMKETAYICRNAGPKSLILMDELGRATSNEDGVAIAWAVAEFLLSKSTTTFFVTHYPQLTKLSDIYPGVQNQHLGATISPDDGAKVLYTHKLVAGPCKISSDYGVEISNLCGWPSDVVNNARQIRKEVEDKVPNGAVPFASGHLEIHKTIKRLQTRLVSLAATSTPAEVNYNEEIRDQLQSSRIALLAPFKEEDGADLILSCLKATKDNENITRSAQSWRDKNTTTNSSPRQTESSDYNSRRCLSSSSSSLSSSSSDESSTSGSSCTDDGIS